MRIFISGASAGLGAEMARQFAALGHDLVLTARRVDRLEEVQAEIRTAYPARTVSIAALDVLDDDAVDRVMKQHAPLDRVIVNAGVGGGKPVGTGQREGALALARTNFVAAVAQTETAMEIFRAQGHGHLVVVSSMSAMRGLRGGPAVYSATKRGVAHLAEALRSETFGSAITVTTVFPGYIRTEMTADQTHAPFTVDTEVGVRAMVRGIERRRATVFAPALPWTPIAFALRVLPLRIVRRLTTPPRGE